MTFEEWLELGINNKWCSPPVCGMHDGIPSTPEEDDDFDMGFDPCYTVLRLFSDPDEYDRARKNTELAWINFLPR